MKNRNLYIGIDVGTTNVKAGIINNSGKIIAISSCKSRVKIGLGGIAEQDGDEIWQSVQMVFKNLLSKINFSCRGSIPATADLPRARHRTRPFSLSLSTQGGTIFFLDKNGKYVQPGITWMDTRPIFQEDRHYSTPRHDVGAVNSVCPHSDRKLYDVTGRISSIGCLPLLQFLWLKKNEPEILERTAKYEFVDSLIYEKLTGRSVIDPSSAVMTMLYDIRKGEWSNGLLKMAGIEKSQLPEILPSGEIVGTIRKEIAKSLGLPEDVKVICGGHDQYCAALGSGVIRPGDIMLSCGTAWALVGIWHKPIFKFGSNFTPGPHVIEKRYGMLTAIAKAGAFFDWATQILNVKDYKEVISLIKKVPDGCENLFFIPLDSGESVFYGLGLHHNKSFLLKSVMEGMSFEIARRIKILEGLGIKPTSITMVGGAAKSKEWVKIISNITGLKVKIPQETESACRGAAMIAASEGKVESCKLKVESFKPKTIYKIYIPSEKSVKVYAEALKKYKKLTENVEGC